MQERIGLGGVLEKVICMHVRGSGVRPGWLTRWLRRAAFGLRGGRWGLLCEVASKCWEEGGGEVLGCMRVLA
jgi:hypothetical protein